MIMQNTVSRYNHPKPPVNTSKRTFATSLSTVGATAPKITNAATMAAEMISTVLSFFCSITHILLGFVCTPCAKPVFVNQQ